MNNSLISQEELKELLYLDQEDWCFYWKPRKGALFGSFNYRLAGKKAGQIHKERSGASYVRITIKGRGYQAHRLVWLYINGEHPKETIDHIDGNPLNNDIKNLRDVSIAENNRNRRRFKNNSSGANGVSWCKKLNKWKAYIHQGTKTVHLGFHQCLLDAVAARKSAELDFGFHRNHGRV